MIFTSLKQQELYKQTFCKSIVFERIIKLESAIQKFDNCQLGTTILELTYCLSFFLKSIAPQLLCKIDFLITN